MNDDFVETHIDKSWSWKYLSGNLIITIEFIEAHPDKPWDWDSISANPNLTIEFIEEHLDKPWHWYYVYKHMLVNEKRDILKNYNQTKI